MAVALKTFKTNNYDKGRGKMIQFIWIFFNVFFLKNSWFIFMGIKVLILRSFGAKIGHGMVIKPNVNIKFPWKLVIGNDVWIGEGVWIDNLDQVTIGNDVCISQGALLLTGNHDYKSSSFDYANAPIVIGNGVWIGAKSVVCPGVICENEAILTVGSVATKTIEAYGIYQGNPAKVIRQRKYKTN